MTSDFPVAEELVLNEFFERAGNSPKNQFLKNSMIWGQRFESNYYALGLKRQVLKYLALKSKCVVVGLKSLAPNH